jgi:hypothetical protein
MTRDDIKDWKSIKKFFFQGSNQRTALIMSFWIIGMYFLVFVAMFLKT